MGAGGEVGASFAGFAGGTTGGDRGGALTIMGQSTEG